MPVAPDGTVWSIRRRWVRRPRWRRVDDVPGFDDAPLFDIGEGFLAALVIGLLLVVALAVFTILLLPLVIRGVDLQWSVRGWRRSRRFIRDLRAAIERGDKITAEWEQPRSGVA